MAISERAGRPADPSILVDVDRLVAAYYEAPDPSDPAQRVAFGTSGHRGSSLNGAFNEAHIAGHHRGDLPLPATPRARMGRCSSARTPTRCPSRPSRPPRGPRRARRRRSGRRRRRLHADARHLARDPRPQPRAARPAGRRHRRHAVAQPARGRRLQVQPAERRSGRHRRDALDPGRGEPPARGGLRASQRVAVPSARAAAAARLRRRATSTTSPRSSTWTRSGASGLRLGVDPLGGASVAYWPRDRRALRPRPDRDQRRRSTRSSRS